MAPPLEIGDGPVGAEVAFTFQIDICRSTESGKAETNPADDEPCRTQQPGHHVETTVLESGVECVPESNSQHFSRRVEASSRFASTMIRFSRVRHAAMAAAGQGRWEVPDWVYDGEPPITQAQMLDFVGSRSCVPVEIEDHFDVVWLTNQGLRPVPQRHSPRDEAR